MTLHRHVGDPRCEAEPSTRLLSCCRNHARAHAAPNGCPTGRSRRRLAGASSYAASSSSTAARGPETSRRFVDGRGWSPKAEALMAASFDKNLVDKDEYPQTAELRSRPLRETSSPSSWHGASRRRAGDLGRRPTGSSEAAMLLCGMALLWSLARAGARAAKPTPPTAEPRDRESTSRSAWEKVLPPLLGTFEPRLAPMGGRPTPPSTSEQGGAPCCDENTIGRGRRPWAAPSTGPTKPVARDRRRAPTTCRRSVASISPCTFDGRRSGGLRGGRSSRPDPRVGLPALVARCSPVNGLGPQSTGSSTRGVGWALWRGRRGAARGTSCFRVNYPRRRHGRPST